MKVVLIYGFVLALAVFNGIFSPYSFVVFALQGIWYPAVLPAPLKVMFILSGLISGLLHLLVTGIPTALVERTFALKSELTGLIWLGMLMFPTFKTLQHLGWL
jgi:hypothetical protein